jgi:glycogen debranching enzyme
MAHLETAGLHHISEIADAEPPYTPRGCPFQAWSLGELLRVERLLLTSGGPRRRRVTSRAANPPTQPTSVRPDTATPSRSAL